MQTILPEVVPRNFRLYTMAIKRSFILSRVLFTKFKNKFMEASVITLLMDFQDGALGIIYSRMISAIGNLMRFAKNAIYWEVSDFYVGKTGSKKFSGTSI